MANPFQVAPPNVLQALLMGQQGFDAGRKSMQDAAMSEAGRLYAAGDVKGAQAAASRGGSLQALMGFANLQNNDRDFAFRQSEAARAQENTNKSFGLQERQLNLTAGQQAAQLALQKAQFDYQKSQGSPETVAALERAKLAVQNEFAPKTTNIKTPGGDEFTVEKGPTGYRLPQIQGQPTESGNPFLTGGPMKDDESKSALYANRMINAERVFRDPAVASAALSKTQRAIDKAPIVGTSGRTGLGNYAQSADYQRYDQAKRDFINAVLRRESGAVIAESEFANAERQYFPQPGDSKEVLDQKQANRIEAIKGIGAAGGRGYRPNASFDQKGNIVERGQPSATGAGSVPPPPPGFVVQ